MALSAARNRRKSETPASQPHAGDAARSAVPLASGHATWGPRPLPNPSRREGRLVRWACWGCSRRFLV
eukprot:4203808-Alexandrium_andersonii.AAC.1